MLRVVDQVLGLVHPRRESGHCLRPNIPVSVMYHPDRQDGSNDNRYPDCATGHSASIVEAHPPNSQEECEESVRP